MISSPRLFALATLLASVILFLVVHTARGATRPAVAVHAGAGRGDQLPFGDAADRAHHPRPSAHPDDAGSTARPGGPAPDSFTVRDLADGLHVARVRLVLRNGADRFGGSDLASRHGSALRAGGDRRKRRLDGRAVAIGDARRRPPTPPRDRGWPCTARAISVDGGATWSAAPGAGVAITARGRDHGRVRGVRRGGQRLGVVAARPSSGSTARRRPRPTRVPTARGRPPVRGGRRPAGRDRRAVRHRPRRLRDADQRGRRRRLGRVGARARRRRHLHRRG